MTTKAQATEEKAIKLDFIKIKTFCPPRALLTDWKDNPQKRRNYSHIIYSINVSQLYDACSQHGMHAHNTTTKWQRSNLKTGTGFKQAFLQTRYSKNQWAHEKYSNSLVIGEIQIKTELRHHLTSTGMAIR